MQGGEALGITPEELGARWGTLSKGVDMLKFGGGFYCGRIEELQWGPPPHRSNTRSPRGGCRIDPRHQIDPRSTPGPPQIDLEVEPRSVAMSDRGPVVAESV